MKIKKILIWIPLIGVLTVLLFSKSYSAEPMYDEYFDYGHPSLVVISAMWQGITTGLFFLILFHI